MKRGIINLSVDEATALLKVIPTTSQESPIYHKVLAACQDDQAQSAQIEVSEEELEFLLDQLGIPQPTDPEAIKSLRKSIQKRLFNLRAG